MKTLLCRVKEAREKASGATRAGAATPRARGKRWQSGGAAIRARHTHPHTHTHTHTHFLSSTPETHQNTPRRKWRLARITAFKSADNYCTRYCAIVQGTMNMRTKNTNIHGVACAPRPAEVASRDVYARPKNKQCKWAPCVKHPHTARPLRVTEGRLC